MAEPKAEAGPRTRLGKAFGIAVSAGEAAIRVDTDEIGDAISAISECCKMYGWALRVFDAARGVEWLHGGPAKKPAGVSGGKTASVLEAIGGDADGPATTLEMLRTFWLEPGVPDSDPKTTSEVQPVVLVVKNFHLGFEGRRDVMAALVQHIVGDKVSAHPEYRTRLKASLYDPRGIDSNSDTGKFLVGLMPAEALLPPEVDPLFKLITHELPDEAELAEVLKNTRKSCTFDEDDSDAAWDGSADGDKKLAVTFALGLTRQQAEGVYAASLVTHGRVVPSYVWMEKSKILNKEGLVELYAGKETFKDVAGLAGAKKFLSSLLTQNEYDVADPDVRAKGVVFVGAPGVGKSLLAKAVGNELGLPILLVNPGNWMGQYVGQSEAKTRKGFQLLKAHAPCIAIIDEVEKVMPKSTGNDSGVGGRMEGAFLTNMNDIKERIFWCFTANSVKKMHEAFLRAERVDGVFYVRLPDAAQRAQLWQMYGKKFFPKEVTVSGKVVAFPGHLSTDFPTVMAELQRAPKAGLNAAAWADAFTLPLMCLPDKERARAMSEIKAAAPDVRAAICLVSDKGWSPAEIRACCRLSRVLNKSIAATQKQIRPVSVSAKATIATLEEWALESALDAETGETYEAAADPADVEDAAEAQAAASTKVRRQVRIRKPD